MRRALFLLSMSFLLSGTARAQIGKTILISAGSSEDHALKEVANATDPTQKIALLDKFMANYGKGDMALAAYEIYIDVYADQKNYDKAFEYGEKMFAEDPDHISTAIKLFELAQQKNDVDRMFDYGERVEQIVARFKAQSAPAGMNAKEWEERKAEALKEVTDNINYVQVTLYQAAGNQTDPARRAALLARYAVGFPDSPSASDAQILAAGAYQQAGDSAKMREFAQKILSRDPANVRMLLLVADDDAERGEDLDKSDEYAKHALDLLEKSAKPAALTDEQWAQQKSVQEGLAWSAIGQERLQRKQNAEAVDALKTAAPLLKSDNFSYARNEYRLGFAYLNLKRLSDARAAFAEAASVDTPYKAPAQEKLAGIPATAPGKHPAKKRP